jgi:hypothetical protein
LEDLISRYTKEVATCTDLECRFLNNGRVRAAERPPQGEINDRIKQNRGHAHHLFKNINMLETIKTELSILVPKELAVNLDFWYNVKDNGYLYIPMSFINYMAHKYGYALDVLNSLDIRQHMLSIVKELANDNFKLESYRQPVDLNQTYMVPSTMYTSTDTKKARNKDRKRLLQDTPLADFDE